MGAVVLWRVSLCAVALAIASSSFAASPDQVRSASGEDKEKESVSERETAAPIVITGSRIPRSDLTAFSLVTMVRGDEFDLVGATSPEELLNQLPQVNPSQGGFVNAPASAATIDLRGLGASRTLVLVNGHRLMRGDPRYLVPDVNSIPTALIRRVEVLTGGAAAADAVAGVVNFILDTRIDGFRIDGEISA